MREVLQELNKEVGIKGSLILTLDGIVVAAEMGLGMEKDAVAALVSGAVNAINKSLAPLGSAPFARLIFTSSHGKMIVLAAGATYVAVVVDREINLDVSLLAVEGAARRIRNMTEIRL
jgi:predicted regulator of Ras-like GTPase activity (Roadblock/LC7/MglB family)